MKTKASRLARLGAVPLAVAVLASLAVASARATTSPQQLYKALLKAPPAASLPPALQGSTAHAGKLSVGARAHHAVGAVEVGTSQAIVGYLVFPTRALTLADLKAYPPDSGPNTVLSRHPAGFPQPAYLIHAAHNGYEVAYVVFVFDNLLVNAWAYGPKGSKKKLIEIVTRDGLWAKSNALRAMRLAG
jgi:hypothetical protein